MASKDINDSTAVSALIQTLDPSLIETVEALRQAILSADKNIGEQIKWNSPSFFYTGEMKPFDPKEYKRDIVVMNVRKERILLVFPTGAKLKDTSGILEGNYTDGRRMVTVKSLEDAKGKTKQLQEVIREWIGMIE